MIEKQSLPTIVAEVFKMLNAHFDYAVLRNYEGLPYSNRSRDIDILIRAKDYKRLKLEMTNVIVKSNYKIVTFFESERLNTFVCGKIEREDIELVQFDFFTHTSVYGHILLTNEEIMASRICTDGVYHVSKEFEFLDKYLYIKYLGAEYPNKYKVLKDQMQKREEMNDILKKMFGINSLQELIDMPTQTFRKKIKQNGKESITNVIRFWLHYIKNILSYKGYSIGFTGPDGSC